MHGEVIASDRVMRLPKRILVGVDCSDTSVRALDHALALAKTSDAAVTVFHAFGDVLASAVDVEAEERRAGDALDAILKSRVNVGDEVKTVMKWIDPAVGILQATANAWADLIVLGTHGRRGLSRAFLGSVAERVVRESSQPVLLIRALGEGEKAPSESVTPRKLLVATDFADASKRALAEAVELAQQIDASITLVHAYANPVYAASDAVLVTADMLGEVLRSAKYAMQLAVDEYVTAKVPILTDLREAPAAPAILEAADKAEADWIVVGTRGRSGVGRLVLGSVAEDVIRRSTRPVLVFHQPK